MGLKLFSVLVAVILFAGCSTVQKPSPVTELQIKVSQLENKVDEKDQEINDLRDQLDALSTQVENAEAPSTGSLSSADYDSPAPSVTISGGNNGDIIRVGISVEALQKALKSAGYYDGSVDGKLGRKTKQGIEQFQKDHGLKSDGIVGKQTWAELKNYAKE